MIRVFLKKDVERLGFAGEIVKVSEGYATNFLIPKKLGVVVTPANESGFKKKLKDVENRKEAIQTKTSMLAEKIKGLKLKITTKVHDDNKLYGSINPSEIVDLLAKEGVSVTKSQIKFDKSIKTTGWFDITVKLSNNLQPNLKLKVEALKN